jgi:hypothetical protein
LLTRVSSTTDVGAAGVNVNQTVFPKFWSAQLGTGSPVSRVAPVVSTMATAGRGAAKASAFAKSSFGGGCAKAGERGKTRAARAETAISLRPGRLPFRSGIR